MLLSKSLGSPLLKVLFFAVLLSSVACAQDDLVIEKDENGVLYFNPSNINVLIPRVDWVLMLFHTSWWYFFFLQ